jgi:ABC-type Na+ transport system ATPase subunit NatA
VSAAVEVKGVTKRFGGTVALDDVSFSIEQGTVLALLGPNGAGKTTLIRVLTTLLAADSGRARVAGLDVRKDARAIRSVIGNSAPSSPARRRPRAPGQYRSAPRPPRGRRPPESSRPPRDRR